MEGHRYTPEIITTGPGIKASTVKFLLPESWESSFTPLAPCIDMI